MSNAKMGTFQTHFSVKMFKVTHSKKHTSLITTGRRLI